MPPGPDPDPDADSDADQGLVATPSPTVLLRASEIDHIIGRLAREISARYPDGAVLVGVLRGSVPFLADLVRRVTVPVNIDFLAITPYEPGTGRVRLLKDLDLDITGRHTVIVEDIVDTGLTVTFLRNELLRRKPRSVAVCALLDRRPERIGDVEVDFVGTEVSADFVIGFGLDHEGRYRNLRLIAAADTEVLNVNPDAYVPTCYGPASRA